MLSTPLCILRSGCGWRERDEAGAVKLETVVPPYFTIRVILRSFLYRTAHHILIMRCSSFICQHARFCRQHLWRHRDKYYCVPCPQRPNHARYGPWCVIFAFTHAFAVTVLYTTANHSVVLQLYTKLSSPRPPLIILFRSPHHTYPCTTESTSRKPPTYVERLSGKPLLLLHR